MMSCKACKNKTFSACFANKFSICLQTKMPWTHKRANSYRPVILTQAALWHCKLPACSIHIMDGLMDPNDQALMDGLAVLGPILLGSRKHQEGNEGDWGNKRHKGHSGAQDDGQPAKEAMTGLLRLMAQVILNHDRALQLRDRQDCFVMFAQSREDGILPLLTKMAKEWKDQAPQQKDNIRWLTLRTHLVGGLLTELLRRAQQVSGSKVGEALWDTATGNGTLLPCGSWPFQQWSVEQKQLVRSAHPPVPMDRMLRNLQVLTDLFQSNQHVVKFQCLRQDQTTVPWILQLTHRDSDAWMLLHDLCHNTIWTLVGMSVKMHSLVLSKQAMQLQDMLGKGSSGPSKGRGKTKTSPKKNHRG